MDLPAVVRHKGILSCLAGDAPTGPRRQTRATRARDMPKGYIISGSFLGPCWRSPRVGTFPHLRRAVDWFETRRL